MCGCSEAMEEGPHIAAARQQDRLPKMISKYFVSWSLLKAEQLSSRSSACSLRITFPPRKKKTYLVVNTIASYYQNERRRWVSVGNPRAPDKVLTVATRRQSPDFTVADDKGKGRVLIKKVGWLLRSSLSLTNMSRRKANIGDMTKCTSW